MSFMQTRRFKMTTFWLLYLTCDLQVHGAVHWKRQRQEVKGVKASTDVATCFALHLGLELAMEQVHHNRTVSSQVVVPGLHRHTHARMHTRTQCHFKHYMAQHFLQASCWLFISDASVSQININANVPHKEFEGDQ